MGERAFREPDDDQSSLGDDFCWANELAGCSSEKSSCTYNPHGFDIYIYIYMYNHLKKKHHSSIYYRRKFRSQTADNMDR